MTGAPLPSEDRAILRAIGICDVLSFQEDRIFGQFRIFSCANTVSARMAAARKAVELRTPIIDVGVSDGRVSLAGSIKYWLPEYADWSACPACYLLPKTAIPRNEELLFTILATTVAIAAHVFVSLATELE